MERKIGEIFEYEGEWYQCVNIPDCTLCDLRWKVKDCPNTYPCIPSKRKDGEEVIFKKLEKVGEPYKVYGHLVQKYRFFCSPAIQIKGMAIVSTINTTNNTIEIEIKQNKEDMEEKDESFDETSTRISNEFKEKLEEYFKESMGKVDTSRLKPFDLQKAKEGKPVCTRDGRKARIICFDKKEGLPIIALVETKKKKKRKILEDVSFYFINGRAISENIESKDDLMMLSEKKESWVNIYKGDDERAAIVSNAYATKEKALDKIDNVLGATYITTNKIEWEE